MAIRAYSLILLFIFITPTLAQTLHPEAPLKRNLIFVEGKATAPIPVSGFRIEADFHESKKNHQ